MTSHGSAGGDGTGGQQSGGHRPDADRVGGGTEPRRRAGGQRDRDAAGRPRNARPRDALGRPLDPDAVGEARAPEDVTLPPPEAVAAAEAFFADDRPFHAHEVLEGCWKGADGAERDLWQGLAQVAVGLTHARRGNARGAAALLRRGAQRVRRYLDSAAGSADGAAVDGSAAPHGIDARRVVAVAEDFADRIGRDGVTGLAPEDLRLRLRS